MHTLFEEVYGNFELIGKIEDLILETTDCLEEIYPLLTYKDRAVVSSIADTYTDKNGVIRFKYSKLTDLIEVAWKKYGATKPLKCAFEPILNVFNSLDFCKILSVSFSAVVKTDACTASILVHLGDGTTIDFRDFSLSTYLFHHLQVPYFADITSFQFMSKDSQKADIDLQNLVNLVYAECSKLKK